MIIAEAGSNHGGSVEKAKHLVEIAANAGADVVKFQLIFPAGLYLKEYLQSDGTYKESAVSKARELEQISEDGWCEVWSYAECCGILPAASVFCSEGVALLQKLGSPFVKIASTDATNLSLIDAAAEVFNTIILSTGMASSLDIQTSLGFLRQRHASATVQLMHCVSRYPCPISASAPHRVGHLVNQFDVDIGYSDHTMTTDAALMALAYGATFFEKHFTYDKQAPGFDHKHAADSKELANYVSTLRGAAESIKHDPEKQTSGERETAIRARRGLYLKRDIRAGELVTAEDLLYVRPSTKSESSPLDVQGKQCRADGDMRKYQAINVRGDTVEACASNHEKAASFWSQEMAEKQMKVP